MWTAPQYRRLVRASGWYDLLMTLMFVTPWTFTLLHGSLQALARAYDLPGELPPFEPAHMLMANVMGSIVCVWSVLRIRDPQLAFGRYDAAGRLLFATWQVYALSQGASVLIGLILFCELAWAVAQLWPMRQPAAVVASGLARAGVRSAPESVLNERRLRQRRGRARLLHDHSRGQAHSLWGLPYSYPINAP